MAQTVLTAKDPGHYNEAIRRAAFKEGHSNKSKIILEALAAHPAVAAELDKLQRTKKK
jgi:hypothetical protein